jgi:hypothetical protein
VLYLLVEYNFLAASLLSVELEYGSFLCLPGLCLRCQSGGEIHLGVILLLSLLVHGLGLVLSDYDFQLTCVANLVTSLDECVRKESVMVD